MKSIAACLLLLVSVCGCQSQTADPQTLALCDKFVIATEPANPISLTEVAELISVQTESSEPQSVVVIGRIHAGDLEPWEAGKASFMLSELPAEGHGEGHDADNCPFCKRRAAKAPTAIVKFVDDNNETLSIDARKLFDLKKDQVVVVNGKTVQGEFNTLAITANQIYVRK